MWLHGEGKSPPFSATARIEASYLFRLLQRGQTLALPHSRPMPSIAPRCHELRIFDRNVTWRIPYRIDPDAVIILEVFAKKTAKTLQRTIEICRSRLRIYDDEADQT